MGDGEAVFGWRDGTLVPTEYSGGPWSPHPIQGSASAGLLARVVESMAADTGMAVSRLSFDLWRPAPVGPIGVETETLRDGRKIGAIHASLMAGGAEVARCTTVLTGPSTSEIDPTPVNGAQNLHPTPALKERYTSFG